jgi:hypothetical protein
LRAARTFLQRRALRRDDTPEVRRAVGQRRHGTGFVVVRRREVAQHDGLRVRVEHELVGHDHEPVTVRSRRDQHDPHEWPTELERGPGRAGGHVADVRCCPARRVDLDEHIVEDRPDVGEHHLLDGDRLAGAAAAGHQPDPQLLVPPQHLRAGARQAVTVERSADVERERDVVARVGRIELREQPHRLLTDGEPERSCPVGVRTRRLRRSSHVFLPSSPAPRAA